MLVLMLHEEAAHSRARVCVCVFVSTQISYMSQLGFLAQNVPQFSRALDAKAAERAGRAAGLGDMERDVADKLANRTKLLSKVEHTHTHTHTHTPHMHTPTLHAHTQGTVRNRTHTHTHTHARAGHPLVGSTVSACI